MALTNVHFELNNKLYCQKVGLAMGASFGGHIGKHFNKHG